MKPREFWIGEKNFDLGWEQAFVAEFPHKDSLDGSIHVIEKSAYDELVKLAYLIEGFSSQTICDEFCGSGKHHPICEQLQKFASQLKRHVGGNGQ